MVIKINFSNKLAYTFIAIGILALVAVGINAYNADPTVGTPSTMGHSIGELELDPLYITSTGVGIGTSSPSAALEVEGQVTVSGNIFAGGNICDSSGYCIGDSSSSSSGGGWTRDITTTPPTVRLTTIGDRVGIGTTTPAEKLDVVGNVRATNFLLSGGATIWNSGNDGAGSGLDSDTLDNKDSSYFERVPSTDAELIEGVDVYWKDSDTLCFGAGTVVCSDIPGLSCIKNTYITFFTGPDCDCDSECQAKVACDGDSTLDCDVGEDVYYEFGDLDHQTGDKCTCICHVNNPSYIGETVTSGEKCVNFV